MRNEILFHLLLVVVFISGAYSEQRNNHGYDNFARHRTRSKSLAQPPRPKIVDTRKTTKHVASNVSKRFLQTETSEIVDDPDSLIKNEGQEAVMRSRNGNLSFMKIETPQWFRPIYNSSYTSLDNFHGSIIVLTSDTILIDTSVAKAMFGNALYKGNLSLNTIHHRDDRIKHKFFDYRYREGRQLYKLDLELVGVLYSGFCVFRITDDQVRFPDRWLIKWTVNYNEFGAETLYPEDKQRIPDIGCSGFKYSKMLIDGVVQMVNTEYPLEIVTYNENRRSIVRARIGDISYEPYSNLDDNFNNASPVFCGIEGNLRFFARRSSNTIIQLIPLHDIANDLRLVSNDTYNKLVIVRKKRYLGSLDPGWMPNDEHPTWYRAVYRIYPRVHGSYRSWYGGGIIALSEHFFLIDDGLKNFVLDSQLDAGRDWLHFDNEDSPTKAIASFKDPPSQRGQERGWPKQIHTFSHINMSLFYTAKPFPGWREDKWIRMKENEDYTKYLNCYYLAHTPTNPEEGGSVRLSYKKPAFIIPDSCYGYLCYVVFEGHDDEAIFKDKSPIMCDGVVAFILVDTKARRGNKGRLAVKIDLVIDELVRSQFKIYSLLVRSPNFSHPPTPDGKTPQKLALLKGMTNSSIGASQPSWMRPMISNEPGLSSSSLRYGGALSVFKGNKFMASEYAMNNVLMPEYYRESGEIILLPKYDKTWIYESEEDISSRRDKSDVAELYQHIDYFNMDAGVRSKGFKNVTFPKYGGLPRYRLDPDGLECTSYIYKGEQVDKLVFTKLNLVIQYHNKEYRFADLDPFDPNSDVNNLIHSGSPVLCNNEVSLMYYIAPYPDNMNRATVRMVRRASVIKQVQEFDGILSGIQPPVWYRLLLSQYLIPPAPKTPANLPQMVVFSDDFFIGVEEHVDTAFRMSFRRGNDTWSLIDSLDQPTPEFTSSVYGKPKRFSKDIPKKRLILGDTGLAIYQRAKGVELLGGKKWLDDEYNLWRYGESTSDCWTYVYRSKSWREQNVTYRFYRVKVNIISCKEIMCDTIPQGYLFQFGAPIVCGNRLSYIYSAYPDPSVPRAIRLSWIYKQMIPLKREFDKINTFEDASDLDQIRFAVVNYEWLVNILPLYVHKIELYNNPRITVTTEDSNQNPTGE